MVDTDITLEWDGTAGHVILLLTGAILLRFTVSATTMTSPNYLPGIVATLYSLLASLGLLVAGAATIDLEEHGRAIAVLTLSVFLTVVGVIHVYGLGKPPGPDAELFAREAVDLVISGQNPYTASMAGAWAEYGAPDLSVTPKLDGSHVTSYSYPAGSFLAVIPQTLLGEPDVGTTAGLATVAAGVGMVHRTIDRLALAPLAIILILGLVNTSFLGVIDGLWMLPTVIAIDAWGRGRLATSGVFLGVAASIKQHPWFLVPFLVVWLVRSARHNDRPVWTLLARWGVPVVGVFTVVNLPWILASPDAWLHSVFTPVYSTGAPLLTQGIGLTQLTTTGALVLPNWIYTGLVALIGVGCVVGYWRVWPRARWIAWGLPMMVLVVHYRSLSSYFLFYAPVAAYAGLHAAGAVRGTSSRTPLIRRTEDAG